MIQKAVKRPCLEASDHDGMKFCVVTQCHWRTPKRANSFELGTKATFVCEFLCLLLILDFAYYRLEVVREVGRGGNVLLLS